VEETKQERRQKQRAKEKAKIPQHGKGLARVYKDAVSKRAKNKRASLLTCPLISLVAGGLNEQPTGGSNSQLVVLLFGLISCPALSLALAIILFSRKTIRNKAVPALDQGLGNTIELLARKLPLPQSSPAFAWRGCCQVILKTSWSFLSAH